MYISIGVIVGLQSRFGASISDGTLHCDAVSPTISPAGRISGTWISERFGHSSCYFGMLTFIVDCETRKQQIS